MAALYETELKLSRAILKPQRNRNIGTKRRVGRDTANPLSPSLQMGWRHFPPEAPPWLKLSAGFKKSQLPELKGGYRPNSPPLLGVTSPHPLLRLTTKSCCYSVWSRTFPPAKASLTHDMSWVMFSSLLCNLLCDETARHRLPSTGFSLLHLLQAVCAPWVLTSCLAVLFFFFKSVCSCFWEPLISSCLYSRTFMISGLHRAVRTWQDRGAWHFNRHVDNILKCTLLTWWLKF